MADLNALIAQGYQTPAPPDPFAQYAKMQQLNAGQTQNALAQYQLAQAQRADQEANALRQSLPAEFDLNNPSHVNAILRASPVGGAALIEKLARVKNDMLTGQKTQGEIAAQPGARAETEARTTKLAAETLDKNLENFNKIYSPLAAASAGAQGITDYVTALYDHPILGSVASKMKPFDAALQENLAAFKADPNRWIAAHSQLNGQGILDTMKGTRQNTDLGGTSRGETIDVYGRVVPSSTVNTKKTITPGEASTAATAAARLAQEGQSVTYQQDAAGNILAVPSKLAPGVAPVARVVAGEAGVPIKGKPSALAEKTAEQQKQMKRGLDVAITELTDATKDGGLIDQSTGSGAGRLADISMGFVGRATPGAIAISKLQPIADIALKMVPRFEGPQSDKDTASYKQAAGQLADPTLPTAIRKEAGKTVLRLMQNRKDQFMSADMEASGATPAPAAPPAPAGNTLSAAEQAELAALRKRFGK